MWSRWKFKSFFLIPFIFTVTLFPCLIQLYFSFFFFYFFFLITYFSLSLSFLLNYKSLSMFNHQYYHQSYSYFGRLYFFFYHISFAFLICSFFLCHYIYTVLHLTHHFFLFLFFLTNISLSLFLSRLVKQFLSYFVCNYVPFPDFLFHIFVFNFYISLPLFLIWVCFLSLLTHRS